MSVETPQIKIDPYKSEVPMAPVMTPTQIPVQDSAPANKIYSRAGGIAEVADMGLKGYLKGLQVKEERKFKEAKATMATQDTAVADAKKRYSDSLVTYGKDDDRTKAAWTEYGGTVNKAADIYQKFAIPETGTKTPKGQKKSKTAPDGAPAAGGFVGALKQFATRNPHLVPELAIMGMRSQVAPGLYGQMTPEMTAQKTQMDALQRQESIQKGTDEAVLTRKKYAGRSESELEKMPPSEGGKAAGFKNALEEYRNAVESLTPISAATKYQTLVDPQGQEHSVPLGTQIPDGWKLYEKPSASQNARVGTEQEFTGQALKAYGYNKDTAPPALLKYLHDSWAYKAAQTTSTSGEHMETDPKTGQLVAVKTYGSSTRGAGAPKPPAGFSPVGENGLPQESSAGKPTTEKPAAAGAKPTESRQGQMTKPPAAPGAGRGAMTAPPAPNGVRDTGIRSMAGAGNTEKVETQEKNLYSTATKNYEAALKNNKAKAPTPESLDAANKEALAAYNAEKAQIILWKAKQVKAVGGDPWKHIAKNDQGVTIGTFDGVNWFNVKTGYPVQE